MSSIRYTLLIAKDLILGQCLVPNTFRRSWIYVLLSQEIVERLAIDVLVLMFPSHYEVQRARSIRLAVYNHRGISLEIVSSRSLAEI